MSRKRIYQAISVKGVDTQKLCQQVQDKELSVSIDVAKKKMRAMLMDSSHTSYINLKFQHPEESHHFIHLLCQLPATSISAAMEPTGTYGDALRSMLWQAGIPVFRVNPVKVNKMAEVYDGVPSMHDVKAAHIIAKMHIDGLSTLWTDKSESERQAESAIRELSFFKDPLQQHLNQLEALLARHWPEVQKYLELSSATLLELLNKYGGPHEIARYAQAAGKLMRKVGGHFLAQEKIEMVLETACTTVGVRALQAERDCLKTLAREIRRLQKEVNRLERKVGRFCEQTPSAQGISEVVGEVTAVVFVNKVGDFTKFESVRSLHKGFGLNLKERSSGQLQGKLKITKRGPGLARKYLWLAAWRWVKKEKVARAWFAKKVERDKGGTGKAIVAVMRKLLAGLWHVARGEQMDVFKLFDVSRLELE